MLRPLPSRYFPIHYSVMTLSLDAIYSELLTKKAKDVPLHATEPPVGREDIAPTHSQHLHEMGVSGQRHAPAALYPRGKDPPLPIVQRLGGPQSWSGHKRLEEKSFRLCRGSKFDRPVVQPVAGNYTD
jgi:hypothetical protein